MAKLNLNKKIIVIYHADCSDGFGGAWAAWRKFGDKARYIPAYHQVPPLSNLKNKEIYFIDFAYSCETIRKLLKNNKKIVVIDHHITSKEVIKIVKHHSYRMENSGSVLAWKYFHPRKKVPEILKHIEDMDLYKFKVPKTKEIFSFLNLFDYNFKVWNKLAADLERKAVKKEYVKKGELIMSYEKQRVERIFHDRELVNFEGYKTFAVNSPIFTGQLSELMIKKLPPIAVIWKRRGGQYIVSLRSNGSSVDVSKLAKRFGGGGHKSAAGFSVDADKKLPWKTLSNNEK